MLGLDFDVQRLALARQFGAETVDLASGEDWASAAQVFSRGRGVDGVLVTASTASDEPMHQAATMCRKRGRIVLVGVTGLKLSRADFFEKELSFQVSCSYGPGHYDAEYEQKGRDYPVGFVRWTEQRNLEAVLDMLAEGKIDTAALVSHRFAIAEAAKAYETIVSGEPSLGILLQYPGGAGVADAGAATVVTTPAARAGAAAGAIPPEHWTQDREVGGGRLVGEACHFIDLLRYLAGAAITSTQVVAMGAAPGVRVRDDKASVTLRFADGSIGTIHYFANGHKSMPKERLEAFCAGRILQLDNFRRLAGWGWPGFSSQRLWRQDKGQQACVEAFVGAIRGGIAASASAAPAAPIPFEEIMEVSRVAIEAAEMARG